MNRLSILILLLLAGSAAFSQSSASSRPRILGIDHVSFYTTATEGVKKLYGGVLGLAAADPIESGGIIRYMAGRQWVGYSAAPDPKATDRMDHVAFSTDNAAGLRSYLSQQGLKPTPIQTQSDRSLSFSVNDPESHRIEFVERP